MGLTQATTAYSGSALPCRARGNSRARKAETLASVDRSPVTRGRTDGPEADFILRASVRQTNGT
jgi:hypothetical protein